MRKTVLVGYKSIKDGTIKLKTYNFADLLNSNPKPKKCEIIIRSRYNETTDLDKNVMIPQISVL